MTLVFSLIEQILSMVLMVLAGFILGRLGIITSEQSRVLSCVCVYLVVPCTRIQAFLVERDMDKMAGLAIGLVASVLIHAMFLSVSVLLRKSRAKFTGEEAASVIYGNAANLVIPMVYNILGPEYVIYNTSFVLIQNTLMWTHGQKLMGGEQSLKLRKILVNPVIVSTIIGAVIFFLGIPVPSFLSGAVSSVAGCIAPISMLVTGLVMSDLDLKDVFVHKRIYFVSAVRLLFFPLLSIFALLLVNRVLPHGDAANILIVTLLCTIGPSASTITQQATLYHNPHTGYVSSINVLTTLCCVVTMPLMSAIFLALI